MRETESRLTDGFPAILMTLVSLIVALTIETSVSSLREIPNLLEFSGKNFFSWSQGFAAMVGPLEYWFTMSLHSTSIRGAFVPRDALGPLVPGLVFIPLASTIGTGAEAVWLVLFSLLMGTAWFAFREFGRRYAGDPTVKGSPESHRISGRLHLAIGLSGVLTAIGVHLETISLGWAASVFVVMMLATIVGHVRWYREWQSVVADQSTT